MTCERSGHCFFFAVVLTTVVWNYLNLLVSNQNQSNRLQLITSVAGRLPLHRCLCFTLLTPAGPSRLPNSGVLTVLFYIFSLLFFVLDYDHADDAH